MVTGIYLGMSYSLGEKEYLEDYPGPLDKSISIVPTILAGVLGTIAWGDRRRKGFVQQVY